MRLEYELTQRDVEHFNAYFFRTSHFFYLRRVKNRIIATLIATVVGILVSYGIGFDFFWVALPLSVLVPVITYFAYPVFEEKMYIQNANKRISRESNKGLMGTYTLSFDQETIELTSQAGQKNMTWSDIEKVDATADYIYIFASSRNAIIIPASAFQNASTYANFVDMVQQYHSRAMANKEQLQHA